MKILIVLLLLLSLANLQVIYKEDILFGEDECPFDCYNTTSQGVCFDGSCQCNQPYLPPYCAFPNIPIVSNQTSNGTISGSGYSYYNFQLNTLNQITITLNILTPGYNGTASLLLQNGDTIPDITNYDFANQSEVNQTTLTLTINLSNQAVFQSEWEMGVYCNTTCDFSVLYVSSYVCPNGCSQNGFCSQATRSCQCNTNFYMPDCSIQVSKIATQSNLPLISSTGWNYFYFNISSTSSGDQLNITVAPLLDSQVFVYIQQYTFPTIFSYTNYFEAVNSTNNVIITKPSQSLWYIGIYSTSTVTYSLYTNYQLLCPNNCNGNGGCGSNGVCSCTPPYQDLDCSLYNQSLTEGSVLSGQVINSGSINYYYLPVLQPRTEIYFRMKLSQFSVGQNPKLYLSYNSIPNPYFFDYISYFDGSDEKIIVVKDNAQVGIWNCAVYIPSGNQTSNFTYSITASTSLLCPNHCSGNGICLDNGKCQCFPNFNYEDCSFYSVNYTGNISGINSTMSNETDWHFYSLEVTNVNQITVSLFLNNSEATLFVRFNDIPNMLFFTRKSQVQNDMHLWTITNQDIYSGTWYIGINKQKGIPINYYISLESMSACVNNCTSPQHGTCVNGQCVCNSPWVLNDCSAPNYLIISGQNMSGSISAEEWNFYFITVLGEDALIITLEEIGSDFLGNIWLYVMESSFPSTKHFMYNNTAISAQHTIYIDSNVAGGGKKWVIGVFGSPKMGFNSPSVQYVISADTGCSGYKSCNSCVEDPNCGWCHLNAFNKTEGSCYGGGANGPSSKECPYVWSFSTCRTDAIIDQSLLVGLYAGISVGVFLFLVLLIVAIIMYRYKKKKKKDNFYRRISNLN